MRNLPDDNDVTSINKRLDAIISILLNPTKFQESSNREKIYQLSSLDFNYNEVAKLLNISPGLVAKEKSVLKKEKKNE